MVQRTLEAMDMSWEDIPANLRTKYLRAGAMQVARLMRLVDRLQVDPADLDALRALLRCFHALSGWGALDGLPIVGLAGQLGEHDCSALLSASVVPERRHLDQIKTLIYLLRRELRQQRRALALAREAAAAAPTAGAAPVAPAADILAALPGHDALPAFAERATLPASPEPAAAAGPGPRQGAAAAHARRALLVGVIEEEAAVLGRFLEPHGIALEAVETSFEAGRILGGGLPDAVIATADLADGTGYVLADYLRGLPGGQRPVVLILGAGGRGGDAGEMVRCGIDAFFSAPADAAAVTGCLAQLLERRDHDAPRVLCLEDDPVEALALRQALHEAGYRVRLCNDPRRLLRLTSSFDAELLLMDVPQPDGTASDLVRRLRQDPRSAIVPIVLLTGADPPQPAAPSLIGTEHLVRPFAAAQLLATVANRIERSRALRRLFAESPPR